MKIIKNQSPRAADGKRAAVNTSGITRAKVKGSAVALSTAPRGTPFARVAVGVVITPKAETRKTKLLVGRHHTIATDAKVAQAAEWEAKLHDSEDVLERMLDEAEAFRAERNARKAALKPA